MRSGADWQRRSAFNVFHNLSMSVFFSRPQEVSDKTDAVVSRVKVECVSNSRAGNASAGLRRSTAA